MVHTFDITLKVMQKRMKKLADTVFASDEVVAIIDGTQESIDTYYEDCVAGIKRIKIESIGNGYYLLVLTIEPQALIEDQRIINLFDCSAASINLLRQRFAEEIMVIAGKDEMKRLDKWSCRRIDYAVNLRTEYVSQCIELAKRGWELYRYLDRVNKKGSATQSSRSVNLNFYDKQNEIDNRCSHLNEYQRLRNDAQDIFRIEVQCVFSSKLKALKKNYRLRGTGIIPYLSATIAEREVHNYYRRVIGYGDYYSQYRAFPLIDQTEIIKQDAAKQRMKDWLRLIATARSVSKALGQYLSGRTMGRTGREVGGTRATFNKYIKVCRQIPPNGLNPITIPETWKKDGQRIHVIPNPMPRLTV